MASVAETRRRVLGEINRHTGAAAGPTMASRWAPRASCCPSCTSAWETVAIRQVDDPAWDRDALIDLLTEFTVGGLFRLGLHPEVLAAASRRRRLQTSTPEVDGVSGVPTHHRVGRRRLARTPAPSDPSSPPGPRPAPVPPPGTAVVIVAGGPSGPRPPTSSVTPRWRPQALHGMPGDAWVVAADSGLGQAAPSSLVHHVVGDMDSVSPEALAAATAAGIAHRHPECRTPPTSTWPSTPPWPLAPAASWSSGRPGAGSTTCSPWWGC